MMCDGHDTKSATLPPEIVLFLIDAPVPCEPIPTLFWLNPLLATMTPFPSYQLKPMATPVPFRLKLPIVTAPH